MPHASSLTIIAVAAFLLPLLSSRLKLPAVVLEILFGILIGPSLANLVHQSELIEFLAELGFLLLMFLSGFEIDFKKLEKQGPKQIIVGFLLFTLTASSAFLIAGWLDYHIFMVLLLTTTSVGLVVLTLRNTKQISTPMGQTILVAALIADIMTVTGVTAFSVLYNPNQPDTLDFAGSAWHLVNIPALFAVMFLFLLLLKRLAWWFPEWFDRIFQKDTEELGVRLCLALLFVFVGLSVALNIDHILGAFLAGMVFALVFRERGNLEQQLSGFSYGFFIPIFFIHVGMQFDWQILMEANVLQQALLLLAAAVVVKLLPAFVLVFRRLSFKQAAASGVLLSARLSLFIALATIGVQLEVLNEEMRSSVILLALITATVCPILFRIIAPPLETEEVL